MKSIKKLFEILKEWREDRKFERKICGDNQILYAILDWVAPAVAAAVVSFIVVYLLKK